MGEIARKFSDSKDFGLWYMIHELYPSITITLEELLRFLAEMICESTEIAINKINEKINADVSATDLEKIVQENVELWFNQINPIINYLFGSLYSKIDDSINNELLKTFGTAVETLRNVKTNLKKLKEPVNNNH